MGDTFGYNAALGFAEETVYGTPVTPAAKFIEFISESIKKDIPTSPAPSVRGRSERRRIDGLRTVAGSVECEPIYAGMERLFKHALGTAVTPVVIGGSIDGFEHVFHLADAPPIGLTLEVNRGDSAAGQTAVYEGCKIMSMSMSYVANDSPRLTIEFAGQDETFINETTVVYPDLSGILLPKGSEFLLEIDDATQVCTSAEWTLTVGLDAGKSVLGSNVIPKLLVSERRVIEGTISVDWTDKVLYQKFINRTATKIEMHLIGQDMGNDNSDVHQILTTFPRAKFTGETPAVDSPGLVMQNLPFYAESTGTGVNDSMWMQIDNLLAAT